MLLETAHSLRGEDVAQAPNRASWTRSIATAITVDHGTDFTSKALDQWAWERGVELDFIWPRKPIENALIESFNRRLRDECLNVNEFVSLEHARREIEAWQQDYNHCRLHGASPRGCS